MNKALTLNKNEKGFASIVVAFIFILIMTLVTIGLAQNARRDQQTALNKELANQAYYAAESGVNEIQAELPAIVKDGTVPSNTCLPSKWVQTTNGTSAGSIDSTNNVHISCATVNPSPNAAQGQSNSVGSSNNILFSVPASTPLSLTGLVFAYGSQDNRNTPATGGTPPISWPTAPTWNSSTNPGFPVVVNGKNTYPKGFPPVIQVSITPLTSTIRSDLIKNTYTFYIYPGSNTNNAKSIATYGQDGYGTGCVISPSGSDTPNPACDDATTNAPILPALFSQYIPGSATQLNSYPYSVQMTNLPNDTGGNSGADNWWLVHWVPFYDNVSMCIEGDVNDDCNSSIAGGSSQSFNNSQVDIDVTAKAKNVIKRLLVVAPYPGASSSQQGADSFPAFAIDTENNCKQFDSHPNNPLADIGWDVNYTQNRAFCQIDR